VAPWSRPGTATGHTQWHWSTFTVISCFQLFFLKTRSLSAGFGRHGMPPPASNDTGTGTTLRRRRDETYRQTMWACDRDRSIHVCHVSIFNDLEWLSKIFSDTKHHVVSLRQLSFLLFFVLYAIADCAVYRQRCVNGDEPRQYERANFDSLRNRNSWTRTIAAIFVTLSCARARCNYRRHVCPFVCPSVRHTLEMRQN